MFPRSPLGPCPSLEVPSAMNPLVLAADYEYSASFELSPVHIVIYLVFMAIVIAGMWKAFVKAGQPGWATLVPIYNIYVLTQIGKKPISWFLLILLVPCVNIVMLIMLMIEIAKQFGKGVGFGWGLVLLGFIFWP